jgi:hypothetical protein
MTPTPHEKVTQSFFKTADVITIIDAMAMEMRDDRNDGWVKGHYRNRLCNIRDYINDKLERE